MESCCSAMKHMSGSNMYHTELLQSNETRFLPKQKNMYHDELLQFNEIRVVLEQ